MATGRNRESKKNRHSRESGNPVLIIATVFLLFFCVNANADQIQRTKISPDGETTISGQFGHDNVKIIITTHIVDIGTAFDREPPNDKKISSCTYSRIPCSPVDNLRIFVNEKELFVPRSVYTDLADLNEGYLEKSGKNIEILFEGGDAAGSYDLEVSFNSKEVLKRKWSAGEESEATENTIYHRAHPND